MQCSAVQCSAVQHLMFVLIPRVMGSLLLLRPVLNSGPLLDSSCIGCSLRKLARQSRECWGLTLREGWRDKGGEGGEGMEEGLFADGRREDKGGDRGVRLPS